MLGQGNPQGGVRIGVAAQTIFESKMLLHPLFMTTAAMGNYPPLGRWMPHMTIQAGNFVAMSPAVTFVSSRDGRVAFRTIGKSEPLGNFTPAPGVMGESDNNEYEAKQQPP